MGAVTTLKVKSFRFSYTSPESLRDTPEVILYLMVRQGRLTSTPTHPCSKSSKIIVSLGIVTHTFNSITGETEVGGLHVFGQHGLRSETLSQKNKTRTHCCASDILSSRETEGNRLYQCLVLSWRPPAHWLDLNPAPRD